MINRSPHSHGTSFFIQLSATRRCCSVTENTLENFNLSLVEALRLLTGERERKKVKKIGSIVNEKPEVWNLCWGINGIVCVLTLFTNLICLLSTP